MSSYWPAGLVVAGRAAIPAGWVLPPLVVCLKLGYSTTVLGGGGEEGRFGLGLRLHCSSVHGGLRLVHHKFASFVCGYIVLVFANLCTILCCKW